MLAGGMVTAWLPSLGVEAISSVGKVLPPSVDSEILTFGASAAPAVPATSQVTVSVAPELTGLPAVPRDVTRNGPAAGSRVSVRSSKAYPPPTGFWSRALRRKLSSPAVRMLLA